MVEKLWNHALTYLENYRFVSLKLIHNNNNGNHIFCVREGFKKKRKKKLVEFSTKGGGQDRSIFH